MTTLIKTKLKKSDDQTNIDKYRVAANITEYHIISIFLTYVRTDSNYRKTHLTLLEAKPLDFPLN